MSFEKRQYPFLNGAKGKRWITLEVIRFTDSKGVHHDVPPGFGTDLASTPRAMWSVLPPHGLYLLPAVVHDWYCEHPELMSRADADALFSEMNASVGVSPVTRKTMYAGVRVGAAMSWIKAKFS